MPQMRAVMSGASRYERPRRKASKKRGGSKMLSSTCFASPPSRRMVRAPSPSTRVMYPTWRVRDSVISLALLAEGRGRRVVGAQGPHDVPPRHAHAGEHARERLGLRGLARAEAAITAAEVARAERAAAGVGDGAEARGPGDQDADVAAHLAF